MKKNDPSLAIVWSNLRLVSSLADNLYHGALHLRDHKLSTRSLAADEAFFQVLLDATTLIEAVNASARIYYECETDAEVVKVAKAIAENRARRLSELH